MKKLYKIYQVIIRKIRFKIFILETEKYEFYKEKQNVLSFVVIQNKFFTDLDKITNWKT